MSRSAEPPSAPGVPGEIADRGFVGTPPFFRRLDHDRDGRLSRSEAGFYPLFDAMDADKDGYVTVTEAFAHTTNRDAPNAPRDATADKSGQTLPPDGLFVHHAELPSGVAPLEGRGFSWPGFLGPARDGIAHDSTPLARAWPETGPRVVWRVKVSGGFGGASVDQGRVFILDQPATNEENIRCFDLRDGAELWTYRYPTRNVRLPYAGSRSVPSVSGDLVWVLGAVGDLRCLDWRRGRLAWRADLIELAGLENPPRWGFSQSPLLVGDLVIVPALNDERGALVAFERASGERRWTTENLGGASYVIPHRYDIAGVSQVILFGKLAAAPSGRWSAVSPDSGKILWAWDGYANPAQVTHPVHLGGGRLWITGGYDVGSRIVSVARDARGDWRVTETPGGNPTAGSQVHTPLLFQGHLYANLNTNENLGGSRRRKAGLGCFDLDGRLLWNTGEEPNFDRGGLLIADGLLFALEGKTGELMLVDPSPEGYRERGRSLIFPDCRGRAWAPLAIAGGFLLARSQTELVCLDVGRGTSK